MILRLIFIAFSFDLASNAKGCRTTAEESRSLNTGVRLLGFQRSRNESQIMFQTYYWNNIRLKQRRKKTAAVAT